MGQDPAGATVPLTVRDVENLPEPILFVGNEAVAMPYDYVDVTETVDPNTPGPSHIRVEAWISAKTLAKSPSVSFRVPFCGFDYQASQPLSFSEPTVVRMGNNQLNTVFRIFYPGFGTGSTIPLSIDLDQTYGVNSPMLAKMSDTEYRFTVPTEVVSRYQNMVVRIGSGEPYLLAIPPEDKPPLRAKIDSSTKPPVVEKGSRGPLEWTGSALDTITDIAIISPPAQGGGTAAGPVPQQFTTYAGGTRLLVFLAPGTTDVEGRVTLECTTSSEDKLTLQLFVTAS